MELQTEGFVAFCGTVDSVVIPSSIADDRTWSFVVTARHQISLHPHSFYKQMRCFVVCSFVSCVGPRNLLLATVRCYNKMLQCIGIIKRSPMWIMWVRWRCVASIGLRPLKWDRSTRLNYMSEVRFMLNFIDTNIFCFIIDYHQHNTKHNGWTLHWWRYSRNNSALYCYSQSSVHQSNGCYQRLSTTGSRRIFRSRSTGIMR